jgi:hypothetical protein
MIFPLKTFPLAKVHPSPKSMVLVTVVPGVICVPKAGTLVMVAQEEKVEVGASTERPFVLLA